MSRILSFTGVALACALLFGACDSFVSDVDDPVDLIPDGDLNNPDQVPFLISGVQQRFATAHDQTAVLASLLSDEFVFGGSQATFPSFVEIDSGDIFVDNNSVDGAYNDITELRFFADDLIDRVENRISFEAEDPGDEEEAAALANLRREALFTGYLYGGIARFFLATYIGLNPDEGGGVISTPEEPGPFVPSQQMYDLALERFRTALDLTDDAYETRAVNALIAKTLLYQATADGGAGIEAQADAIRSAAEAGLEPGDAFFGSLHSALSENFYYTQAGLGRTQMVPDSSYADRPDAVIFDRAAFPPTSISSSDVEGVRVALQLDNGEDAPLRQVNYPDPGSPLPLVTWQEVQLILAELALEADSDDGDALERVNAVRASHIGPDGEPLEALDSVDLDGLLSERAGELFAHGDRLVDQRRYPAQLGFPDGFEWRFLPITQGERNANPNIPNRP